MHRMQTAEAEATYQTLAVHLSQVDTPERRKTKDSDKEVTKVI